MTVFSVYDLAAVASEHLHAMCPEDGPFSAKFSAELWKFLYKLCNTPAQTASSKACIPKQTSAWLDWRGLLARASSQMRA
eukprot:1161308-Pelagomonas_calceolata.AAC.5